MATLTNINTPVVGPSAAPLTHAIAAAGDQFAAEHGAVYVLRFTNASATPGNVVLDDPVSVNPGSATQFNPDVTVSVPAGQTREIRVDANRFRNSSGNIVWTYSADMTNAGSLVQINKIQ